MPSRSLSPEHFIPLTPAVFHILLVLGDGEHHGYAIMQEVTRQTEGQLRMGPGTLYGTIKRMLADRLIEETDHRPDPTLDDERRRYYRLTEFGAKVAAAEVKRMTMLVKTARGKRLIAEAKGVA